MEGESKATLFVFAACDVTFLRWEMEEGWVKLLLSLLVRRVRGVGRVHCLLAACVGAVLEGERPFRARTAVFDGRG
jgi:hypothetical protein